MAELSQDENMLHAFDNGLDIHSATAARVFGVELEEVTKKKPLKLLIPISKNIQQ